MEKIFDTLIKKDHKFGSNNYVIGRITGMQEAICRNYRDGYNEPDLELWHIPGKGDVTTVICEPSKYESFSNLVEKWYPGLCEFDVNLEELDR